MALPKAPSYIADEQTAGRGRGGHQLALLSQSDGLVHVSVLDHGRSLPPRTRPSGSRWQRASPRKHAIREVRRPATRSIIRWPNDLLVSGGKKLRRHPRRNLCGLRRRCPTLRFAVIGIGININHASVPDRDSTRSLATSLRHHQAAARPEAARSIVASSPARPRPRTDDCSSRRRTLRSRTTPCSIVSPPSLQHGCNGKPCPRCRSKAAILASTDWPRQPQGFLRVIGRRRNVLHTVLSGGVRDLL